MSKIVKPNFPFSIRLSAEERKDLEKRAGNVPLGIYIRSLILDNTLPRYYRRRMHTRAPVKDYEALAKILGKLGREYGGFYKLAQALQAKNDIDPEIRSRILAAHEDIGFIRRELIRALGLRPLD